MNENKNMSFSIPPCSLFNEKLFIIYYRWKKSTGSIDKKETLAEDEWSSLELQEQGLWN